MNMNRYIIILILLAGLSVTNISAQSFQNLTKNDINWLSDSTQKKVARLLTKGKKCVADLMDCKERVSNRDFQIGKQSERIAGFMVRVDNLNDQKRTIQLELVTADEQITLQNKEIARLKINRWLIISVSGVAIIGAVIITSQLK